MTNPRPVPLPHLPRFERVARDQGMSAAQVLEARRLAQSFIQGLRELKRKGWSDERIEAYLLAGLQRTP